MNEFKIEIIVASNNDQYLEECLAYIQCLDIPEGYELSFMNIVEAASMTSAYNEAMHSSDAKYKIYIHQDTFLVYPALLCELVTIFKDNPEVGMIGVLGGTSLGQEGIAWNAWNCGRTRAWNTAQELEINFQTFQKLLVPVQAIDGMFMATQYDIEWREDIIEGWDYYDISQSCEFIRKGYQVAVPFQENVWCLHDCGHSKLKNYEQARKAFCAEYSDFGFQYNVVEATETLSEKYTLIESVLELAKKIIVQKDYLTVEMMLSQVSALDVWVTEVSVLQQIIEIIKQENLVKNSCFEKTCENYEELIQKYTQIKFALRRMEYGLEQNRCCNVIHDFNCGELSRECLDYMVEHCIYQKTEVKKLLEEIGA